MPVVIWKFVYKTYVKRKSEEKYVVNMITYRNLLYSEHSHEKKAILCPEKAPKTNILEKISIFHMFLVL
jgi:hypothetical protein